uniref:DUF1428 domain-containing protein n=1 Tax=uncultured Erythrobacter sp. TaxID=263913 RepID=UPI002609DF06|nr:DUF1428 domain-containing protein [uncultured Erythrobacter sp.]
MHVMGAVLAVPEGKKADYLEMARWMGDMFREFGAIEVAENWEEDVKGGEQTDFRKAVKAEAGEKIVFSWIVWPDKATHDAAHEKMMSDPRMQEMPSEMPFDGGRMIFGSFENIFHSR